MYFHFTQIMISVADYQLINAQFFAQYYVMASKHLHSVCELTHFDGCVTSPTPYIAFLTYSKLAWLLKWYSIGHEMWIA